MKVYPIAFDSLGVRSMATFIKSYENIFIDPYASLAPKRFGLYPHNIEYEHLKFFLNKIYEIGKKTDIAIITHYHYDHHPRPYDEDFFENFSNAHFLIKNFENEHKSAKIRGKKFVEKLKEYKISYNFADGKEFVYSERILFSKPVWHGEENSKVGRVIMVLVNSFLHGSDAQNLMDRKALKFVIKNKPKYLIIDGFPIVFIKKFGEEKLKESNKNIIKIIEKIDFEWLILDHHIARSKDFKEKISEILKISIEKNKRVCTAAEFYGIENLLLEANRKELYNGMKINIKNFEEKFEKILDV
jgi:predicted metallo-beta-lactamase superfamily hydrolase